MSVFALPWLPLPYPEHTEKGKLFDWLEVTDGIGTTLTESYAMLPASSVSGFLLLTP